MKKTIIFALIAPIIGLSLAFVHGTYLIQEERQGGDTTFTIKKGESLSAISKKLFESRLISSQKVFYFFHTK